MRPARRLFSRGFGRVTGERPLVTEHFLDHARVDGLGRQLKYPSKKYQPEFRND